MMTDIAKSSGEKAIDTQIVAAGGSGLVTYVEVKGNGGAGQVRLYSGTSAAAAAKLAELTAADGVTVGVSFPTPVQFNDGLFMDVNATTLALCHYL